MRYIVPRIPDKEEIVEFLRYVGREYEIKRVLSDCVQIHDGQLVRM